MSEKCCLDCEHIKVIISQIFVLIQKLFHYQKYILIMSFIVIVMILKEVMKHYWKKKRKCGEGHTGCEVFGGEK